ncbi:DUF4190 domain-containing protein [Alkalihalobacillus sp. 1P02AB]|uniref:DUF4190 domain-containing protein n=1 Tax=Alkalihalobacillus sp. 1P02AB TaxID=3132260 RepID=UPI0039A41766
MLSFIIPYVGIVIGILAIILATFDFKKINISQDDGKRMAVAGLICGIITTAIYIIYFFFVVLLRVMFMWDFICNNQSLNFCRWSQKMAFLLI